MDAVWLTATGVALAALTYRLEVVRHRAEERRAVDEEAGFWRLELGEEIEPAPGYAWRAAVLTRNDKPVRLAELHVSGPWGAKLAPYAPRGAGGALRPDVRRAGSFLRREADDDADPKRSELEPRWLGYGPQKIGFLFQLPRKSFWRKRAQLKLRLIVCPKGSGYRFTVRLRSEMLPLRG